MLLHPPRDRAGRAPRRTAPAGRLPRHLPRPHRRRTRATPQPGPPARAAAAGRGHRVTFHDRLHGEFTGVVDDIVLRRGDGTPAYNLAVVVDDAAQGIDQVVRGDDLLPSSPRQAHLATLLGLPVPQYAHVPLVLNEQHQRLAKRDGAVTLADREILGEAPTEVLSALTQSLNLATAAHPRELLPAFDPDRLPRDPWIFTP